MSSSSSIAAARRRRAGGVGGPVPPTSNTSNVSAQGHTSSQQQTPSAPINPLVLLQQHHIKINAMEQMINEISLKQSALNVNSTNSSSNNVKSSPSQPDLNLNELSDLIMNKVEGQLDLKAFYENDERLMTEIEELKTMIKSQQMVINGLNNTLYIILGNLNMSPLSETLTDADAGDDADAASQDDADVDKHNQAVATFPKSVVTDEANKSIKDFIADTLGKKSDVTEYDSKNSITFEGSLQA
jgi:hypothetical protein